MVSGKMNTIHNITQEVNIKKTNCNTVTILSGHCSIAAFKQGSEMTVTLLISVYFFLKVIILYQYIHFSNFTFNLMIYLKRLKIAIDNTNTCKINGNALSVHVVRYT